MSQLSNLLVVSDLHFGEELLPGASPERRRAVELASTAFRENAHERDDVRTGRLQLQRLNEDQIAERGGRMSRYRPLG